MEMRTCNSCRLDLPLVLFGKGRHTCKACQKRYREVNQERIRQRKQEYYRKNREEILRTQKEKYSINSDWKEKCRRRGHEYQVAHRAQMGEYCKKRYEENKDEILGQQRAWYHANKQVVSDRTLLRTYGIARPEFDALLVFQGGGCAICGAKTCGGMGRFHVDHNHETKEIRGLLCHRCNTAIGSLKDTPSIIEGAIVYLGRPDTDIKFHKSFLEYHRDQFEALAKVYDGKCQICGSEKPGTDQYEHLCIDHNHASGMVRGILCSPCNAALGLAKESTELLRKAIAYLQNPPYQQFKKATHA